MSRYENWATRYSMKTSSYSAEEWHRNLSDTLTIHFKELRGVATLCYRKRAKITTEAPSDTVFAPAKELSGIV